MSKIPKFESKLKKPQTVDLLKEMPVFANRPKNVLRRSRSFESFSSLVRQPSTSVFSSVLKPKSNNLTAKPSNITKVATQLKFSSNQAVDKVPELPVTKTRPARVNLRRSRSVCDFKTSVTKPLINKVVKNGVATTSRTNLTKPIVKPNIVQRTGVKRPGEKCETELKNKVLKKKVPEWDYKTRFTILQEKYNSLQSQYKIAEKNVEDARTGFETEILDLQTSQAALKEKVAILTGKNEDLINYKTDLENKYKQTHTDLEELKKEFDAVQNKFEHYFEKYEAASKENKYLLNKVYEGEQLRRKLHNTIQDLKGNIRVFCRVRPALTEDEKSNLCNFNFNQINSMEISKLKENESLRGRGNESQEFTFDRVFDTNATQEEVFEELAQLIQSAMDGYHVCVFAYGQTGSGKTYTMQGNRCPPEALGMTPRSVQLLFDRKTEMEKQGWTYEIRASFLEIYNENIRDLLNMQNGSLDIKYNEGRGTSVPNLTVKSISSADEMELYMYKSQQNRSTAVTNFNEHSSRSHSVTKIYIQARHKDFEDVYVGSVSLVDLAGSESAKSVSSVRLAETKNINKSLSNLGNVLMALHKKDTHVPYRNSKLTFLLQSSLGGNCKCLMFVNISPVNSSYNESLNALRFAAKVKEVKIASSKNRLVTN